MCGRLMIMLLGVAGLWGCDNGSNRVDELAYSEEGQPSVSASVFYLGSETPATGYFFVGDKRRDITVVPKRNGFVVEISDAAWSAHVDDATSPMLITEHAGEVIAVKVNAKTIQELWSMVNRRQVSALRDRLNEVVEESGAT